MTDPTPQADTATLLCIGGRLHAATADIQPTDTTWTDLQTASTYYVKPMNYTRRDPATGRVDGLFEMHVLVHESLKPVDGDTQVVIAQKTHAVMQMWMDVVLRLFMEVNGIQKPLSEDNGRNKLHLPGDGGNLR